MDPERAELKRRLRELICLPDGLNIKLVYRSKTFLVRSQGIINCPVMTLNCVQCTLHHVNTEFFVCSCKRFSPAGISKFFTYFHLSSEILLSICLQIRLPTPPRIEQLNLEIMRYCLKSLIPYYQVSKHSMVHPLMVNFLV